MEFMASIWKESIHWKCCAQTVGLVGLDAVTQAKLLYMPLIKLQNKFGKMQRFMCLPICEPACSSVKTGLLYTAETAMEIASHKIILCFWYTVQ